MDDFIIFATNYSLAAEHNALSPGGEDDDDPQDDDWSDIDDENFEDLAEDEDDLHEMRLNDTDLPLDPDDDDHLPDDDLQ